MKNEMPFVGDTGVVTSWNSRSSLSDESIDREFLCFTMGGIIDKEDCREPTLEGGLEPHADVLTCANLFRSLGRDRLLLLVDMEYFVNLGV